MTEAKEVLSPGAESVSSAPKWWDVRYWGIGEWGSLASIIGVIGWVADKTYLAPPKLKIVERRREK